MNPQNLRDLIWNSSFCIQPSLRRFYSTFINIIPIYLNNAFKIISFFHLSESWVLLTLGPSWKNGLVDSESFSKLMQIRPKVRNMWRFLNYFNAYLPTAALLMKETNLGVFSFHHNESSLNALSSPVIVWEYLFLAPFSLGNNDIPRHNAFCHMFMIKIRYMRTMRFVCLHGK